MPWRIFFYGNFSSSNSMPLFSWRFGECKTASERWCWPVICKWMLRRFFTYISARRGGLFIHFPFFGPYAVAGIPRVSPPICSTTQTCNLQVSATAFPHIHHDGVSFYIYTFSSDSAVFILFLVLYNCNTSSSVGHDVRTALTLSLPGLWARWVKRGHT